MVYLGAEFHPPAVPEPEPPPVPEEDRRRGIEEPQPIVPGQPTADAPRIRKGGRKAAGPERDGKRSAGPKRARKPAAPRKRKAPTQQPTE